MNQSKIIYKYIDNPQLNFYTFKGSQIKVSKLKEKLAVREGCAIQSIILYTQNKETIYNDADELSNLTTVYLQNKTITKESIKKEEECISSKQLRKILQNARFFIVKSMNEKNIEIAKANNKWVTTPTTINKMKEIFFQTDHVILFFTYKQASNFHGLALMKTMPDDKPTPELWSCPENVVLTGNFQIQWIKKTLLPSKNLINKINPLTNQLVTKGRNCQQIDKQLAKQLVYLFQQHHRVPVQLCPRLIQEQQNKIIDPLVTQAQVDPQLPKKLLQTHKKMWENIIMEQKLKRLNYEDESYESSYSSSDSISYGSSSSQNSSQSDSQRSNSSSSQSSSIKNKRRVERSRSRNNLKQKRKIR